MARWEKDLDRPTHERRRVPVIGGRLAEDVKREALALLELGYTQQYVAQKLGISLDAVNRAAARARAANIRLSPAEVQEYHARLKREAERQVEALKRRFGEWAAWLSDDLFEIGRLTAKGLRRALEELNRAIEAGEDPRAAQLKLVRQLTGTLDYVIRDVALISGMPTSRQAVAYEGEAKAPFADVPRDQLAESLEALARELRQGDGPALGAVRMQTLTEITEPDGTEVTVTQDVEAVLATDAPAQGLCQDVFDIAGDGDADDDAGGMDDDL